MARFLFTIYLYFVFTICHFVSFLHFARSCFFIKKNGMVAPKNLDEGRTILYATLEP